MNINHIILLPITSCLVAIYYATTIALLPIIAIVPLFDCNVGMWKEWIEDCYISIPIWILTGK